MKLSTFFTVICLAFFATSCNVTESIVFNDQMGGTYKTTFDMAAMMAMANESQSQIVETEAKKAVDTTIVFSEFIEKFKDSIAKLPQDKQAQLLGMKGVVMHMQMDDANGIFNFSMETPFVDFSELKQVNEQIAGAMNVAENFGKHETGPNTSQDQLDELTKKDPIIYTFADNVFSRSQPKTDEALELEEGEESNETEAMANMFKNQFEDMFKNAFYTMTYTFPKAIKSTSNKDAVLSNGGMTMTLKNNLNAIEKDANLMNLEVILED